MIKEAFADLFEESLKEKSITVGTVVTGKVVDITNEYAIIDVQLKSEGRVSLKEFVNAAGDVTVSVGDEINVYVERLEDKNGEIGLSREKAKREEAWGEVSKIYEKKERVEGVIFSRVKGGFMVDVMGAIAFLPGSQVDVRPIRDMEPLMNTPIQLEILKMDQEKGNIVVSRRAIIEEKSLAERHKIMDTLEEGQIVDGIVKNITDYGAFIDLGGVDGLLHITDISWKRINHPSEALKIGENIKVKITKFNSETKRISLGIKQMVDDPWNTAVEKYSIGSQHTGKVTNIADYGAFIELEEGIEGLVHVSELSWTKKNIHPGKIVSTSQTVDVKILEIDSEKRRISLGIKQCYENPWETISKNYPVGTVLEGEVKSVTEFGLFIGITEDIDGMVHMSDIAHNVSGEEALEGYKKGNTVKAVVLDIDVEKERVSLGIKQLEADIVSEEIEKYKKGDIVTAVITKVTNLGLECQLEELTAFIKKYDISKEKSEQNLDNFKEGDTIEASVIGFSKRDNRLNLSVKSLQIAEEKEALEQYGSSDSGATLGDILGKALDKK